MPVTSELARYFLSLPKILHLNRRKTLFAHTLGFPGSLPDCFTLAQAEILQVQKYPCDTDFERETRTESEEQCLSIMDELHLQSVLMAALSDNQLHISWNLRAIAREESLMYSGDLGQSECYRI